MTQLTLQTADGTAAARVFRSEGAGDCPGILLYPDAFGLRPSMDQMAERLASEGNVVLTPNVFYREGDYPPFQVATLRSDPGEMQRLTGMIQRLDNAAAMRDAATWIDALTGQPGVRPGPVGCLGYCMGGRLAFLTAASHPERVAAAASIHGGQLATPAPDSPHLLAARVKARLYFGVADNDRSASPESQAMLREALDAAKVRYQLELYPAAHGFAVLNSPSYDAASAERHWERILALFRETLALPA